MWPRFAIASIVIFFAGRYLSDLADETAEITGLSKGFIGALILGLITSLPELVGTVTAVVYNSNPDLGVGNIFGSNLYNIAIISGAILIYSKKSGMYKWTWGANFSAYLSISLSAFMVMLIGMNKSNSQVDTIFWDVLILCFYAVGMWMYSRQDQEVLDQDASDIPVPDRSLKANILLIVITGSIVVVAGVVLAGACDEIAGKTNMSSTFVGSLLMAAATSLPELVVTMRLLKIGNIGMATGNIFGSNLMNLTIVAIADLIYGQNVYETITSSQLVTLGAGMLMSGIFLSGGLVKSTRKVKMHMDNVCILILYLLTYLWLYNH